jgi:hypothetical protein
VINYQIKIYNSSYYEQWNTFVSNAKNATFLFHRDFMEYHKDRFVDYSLLVFDEKDSLVSILPANRVGTTLFSHQGLTYGGFVFTAKTKLSQSIKIVHDVLKYLNLNGISEFNLKQIPTIYNKLPSDELDYICFLLDAITTRKDSLSVIDLFKKNKITNTRKENINRGKKNKLIIKEETNFELFWKEILIPNLDKKHQAKPVHTVEEIAFLREKFPENIRHFNVYDKDKIVAGTTMFLTENVAKPQYISGNENKNELGSIDFLYAFLIDEFKDKNFFDFGPSNENNGRTIKEGILFWKESFGARTQVQNFYEIQTKHYVKLENVLL